jgi:uncharacterized protein
MRDVFGTATSNRRFTSCLGSVSLSMDVFTEYDVNVCNRFDHLDLMTYDVDGYICEYVPSLETPSDKTPSAMLSKYFGKPVHLIYKGPRRRACIPTAAFPELDASLHFQDGYPLLVVSEESVRAVGNKTKESAGAQGIGDVWKDKELLVERCVLPLKL